MDIGHYAPDLWARGGISTYVRRLGQAQDARDHTVHYFTGTDRSDSPPSVVVEDDTQLFDTAASKGIDLLHLHKPLTTFPDNSMPVVRTMHGNQGGCPSGSRYLKRSGQPCPRTYNVVECTWGHFVDHCGSRRPNRWWANMQNIRHEHEQAAQIPTLTVSQYVHDRMIDAGCPSEHLEVLRSPAPEPNGPYAPPPSEGAPRFVYLGRLASEKGVDWLLDAAAQVPGIHVDVAGTGAPAVESALCEQVRDLGIEDRVTFHGWLESPDAHALLESARAAVVPSMWHEPAGLVALEAASTGRAVVASRVGGIPEYARSDFAFQVSPGDTEAMADRLQTLAENYDRAAAMGRRGRSLAETQFSMDTFLDRLDDIYDRVIRSTPVPS